MHPQRKIGWKDTEPVDFTDQGNCPNLEKTSWKFWFKENFDWFSKKLIKIDFVIFALAVSVSGLNHVYLSTCKEIFFLNFVGVKKPIELPFEVECDLTFFTFRYTVLIGTGSCDVTCKAIKSLSDWNLHRQWIDSVLFSGILKYFWVL